MGFPSVENKHVVGANYETEFYAWMLSAESKQGIYGV